MIDAHVWESLIAELRRDGRRAPAGTADSHLGAALADLLTYIAGQGGFPAVVPQV
ncbi:hypothetical protein [Streptomyces sioyaensis]|uniref:hypothetical protein n=1 Tax=Streptomyces sioyaensis TaxID=67364 RepID=UPI003D71D1D8